MKKMKNKKYILIFGLLVSILYQCKKDKNLTDNENKESINNKIVLIGTSNDKNALKNLLVLNNSYFSSKNHKNVSKTISNNSIRIVVDSIKNSHFFELLTISDTIYRTHLYVNQIDSLNFKIDNSKIKFTDKKYRYLNVFNYIDSLSKNYNQLYCGTDLSLYKKKVDEIYLRKRELLKQFIRVNPKTPKKFLRRVSDILKFEYLMELMLPRNVKSKRKNGLYINNFESVLSIVESSQNNEVVFDPKNYFENIKIEDFKNPLLVNNHYYKNIIIPFVKFYFVGNSSWNYTEKSFNQEKKFIIENFEEPNASYAIAKLIRDYNEKGFGFSKKNIEVLNNTILEYDSVFSTKPTYKLKMDKIKESLTNFNFKLTEYALETKLINPMGDTTSLGKIFKMAKNKVKVIDFWASWCNPCIEDIKKTKIFKNEMQQKNNVELIYISVDKDKNKWLDKINNLQKFLNTEHQYLLINGNKSSLAKSLKISSIPRYTIFDKKDRIILDNAPAISDTVSYKKIIRKFNN